MDGTQARRLAVARACRILEHQGHEHSFLGHVSARESGGDELAMKPAGRGLGEVASSDVVTIDLAGELVAGTGPLHSEVPIHTRIYRARPDVNAVVHTHPVHAAGLLASDADFALVNQDSVHFVDRLGWLASPRLIVTAEQGDELARELGTGRAVLIRNHGIVTVGASVQEAVFWAVSLVNSLRVQAMAERFGNLRTIDPEVARDMAAHFSDGLERRVSTTWDYLVRLAGEPG